MELTAEQGSSRPSQVQPPRPVWEQFVGVSPDSTTRPTFRLENMRDPGNPEQRKVVKHHHNLTIEISAAKVERPAIIRLQQRSKNSYAYWVYGKSSKEYNHCKWIVTEFGSQAPNEQRGWLIISRNS